MFSSLSQREKNLLFVLLTLGGLFVIYKYVILKEIAYYTDTKVNYATLDTKIKVYRQKVVKIAELKKEQKDLQAQLAEATAPFHVDIMGGQQMRFIGERLENAGLKILETTPVSTRVYDDYYIQDLNFKLVGTYGGLQQFFFDTENSKYTYKILKFEMLPQITEGMSPQLVSLNYNKLSTNMILSVVGDKLAKVEKPANQFEKFDIFKPSDAEFAKLVQEQAKITVAAQEANPAPAVTTPAVPVNNVPYDNPEPTSTKVTQTTTHKGSVTPKPNKQDIINYNFEKR